jgi:hypothetical protein
MVAVRSPVIPMSEWWQKEFVYPRGHQTPRRRRFSIRKIFEFREIEEKNNYSI